MDRNRNQWRSVSGVGLLACALLFAGEPPRQTAGHYRVTLRLPAEGLYAQEESQIEFRIEDTARPDPLTGYTPVVRATPHAAIDMPAMPRMPEFVETAHAEPSPGDYGIHPTFAHGGDYRLRITVEPGVVAEFSLSVNDASVRRKSVPPRYTLELTSAPKKAKAGEPVDLRLVIRDRDNRNAPVTAFDIAHEKLLHLIVIRRDFACFAHEHPSPNADGSFTLRYTFPAPGDYRLFADTAPQGAGSQILSATLTVGGKAADPPAAFPGLETRTEIIRSGKTLPLRMPVQEAQFEPWLGAIGHLLLIHEDTQTFVHAHPDESGTLTFLTRFPKAGLYHGWLQYQSGGQLHTFRLNLHAE